MPSHAAPSHLLVPSSTAAAEVAAAEESSIHSGVAICSAFFLVSFIIASFNYEGEPVGFRVPAELNLDIGRESKAHPLGRDSKWERCTWHARVQPSITHTPSVEEGVQVVVVNLFINL